MSPASSDSARGSSSNRWDPIGSSFTNIKGGQEPEECVVDDKQTASRAVAFVVQNSRRGIVHLCAEVANLMKAKTRLEVLVQGLEEENAHLKEQKSHVCTNGTLTPSPPSTHSSDHHHCPSRRVKNRSLRYTGLKPGSPPLSSSKLLTCGEGDILRVDPSLHSTNPSDPCLPGRTKNRSWGCSKLRSASPLSTSPYNSPGEGIYHVPLLPSTVHSPTSSESLNSRGTKNRSLRCTKVKKSSSSTSFSSVISPSEGLSERTASESHPIRDETALTIQKLLLPGDDGGVPLQDGSIPGYGGVKSCGNVHTVTVEVHHTSQDEPEVAHCDPGQGSVMFQSKGVGTNPCPGESVGVQCSIGDSEIHYLDDRIKTVEKEKADLENDNKRIQGEMGRLLEELTKLKAAQEVKEVSPAGMENRTNRMDRPPTVCNPGDGGSNPHSLPGLVEPHKEERIAVKSLNKITARCTFHLGDRVLTKGNLRGRVRYIGTLKHQSLSVMFAGLQLEVPVGNHDGFAEGFRYFLCPRNYGILIPVQDVHTVIASKSAKRPRIALSSLNKVSPYRSTQQKTPTSKGGPVWTLGRNKDHMDHSAVEK